MSAAKELENRLAKLAKPLPGLNLSGPSPLERLHQAMSRGLTPEESDELEAKTLVNTSYPKISLENARVKVAEKRKAPLNILTGQRRSLAIIANNAAQKRSRAIIAKNAAKAAQNRMNRLATTSATTSAVASSSGSSGGRRKSHRKHKKHARRTRRHR